MLVHGFTQTRRSWDRIAAPLAADHEVIAVDVPGHGESGHQTADIVEGAQLLGAAGGRAAYIGYSMGGRLCLRLALDRPDLVERLVLIGASPGIADEGERAGRRAADEELAVQLEGDGLAAFIDDWLAQPLFSGLDELAAGRADRLRNDAAHLAASLRNAGTGAQESLWSRLGDIRCPVLYIAGADDPKFIEIGRATCAAIRPSAELVAIDGAGHSVHLEQPERTVAVLASWLEAHPPSASPAAAATP